MTLADFGVQYNQRRRSAGYQRDARLAQNSYSRFLAQDRGARSLEQLNRGMNRGMENLGSGFGRRGLRNSGIFAQAQSDYGSEWTRQQQQINDQVQQALRQADLSDASAWADYSMSDADMDEAKYNEILATAAQLQPLMGG
jgi:hypothetical protein